MVKQATRGRDSGLSIHGAITALLLLSAPGVGLAEILWSGDYETGNFLQWHKENDKTVANYSQIPSYGRPGKARNEGDGWPASYYGDGSLLQIVTSPVRQGRYAAKVVVKNSEHGAEPDDCDVPFPTCDRRRTELTVQATLPKVYNALPYMSERWLSVSHFVPVDWDSTGSGFGAILFQIKPINEQGLSDMFSIELEGDTWTIWHNWSPTASVDDYPWQHSMFYTSDYEGGPYPRADYWSDGLAHFPDAKTSQAALASVNYGGWTDWVIHVKFDARGVSDGGKGFLDLWKREGDGPWVQVLHIFPGRVSRGGMTFDHGIGYPKPASGSNPGGFGIKAGMYMDVDRVWNADDNRVIYNDNIRVGTADVGFAKMSPDGSAPGKSGPLMAAPNPPIVQSKQQ